MRKKITTENFESGTKVSLYFHPVKKMPIVSFGF